MSTDSDDTDDAVGKFEIDCGDGQPLAEGDTVVHAAYGPLTVDQVYVSNDSQRAEFIAEAAPHRTTVEFSGSEIRDMWGADMAVDPDDLDAGDGTDDAVRIDLTDEAYGLLLSYQADDESLTETLDRVLRIVPHPARLPDSVDQYAIENERFVVERQYDEDRLLETYTYDSGYDLYKRYRKSMDGDTDSPRLSEGDEIIDCGDPGEIVAVRQGTDPVIYRVEHESGQINELTAQELELALVDGSIEVVTGCGSPR